MVPNKLILDESFMPIKMIDDYHFDLEHLIEEYLHFKKVKAHSLIVADEMNFFESVILKDCMLDDTSLRAKCEVKYLLSKPLVNKNCRLHYSVSYTESLNHIQIFIHNTILGTNETAIVKLYSDKTLNLFLEHIGNDIKELISLFTYILYNLMSIAHYYIIF
jgi:hypothetical protein